MGKTWSLSCFAYERSHRTNTVQNDEDVLNQFQNEFVVSEEYSKRDKQRSVAPHCRVLLYCTNLHTALPLFLLDYHCSAADSDSP